MNKFWEDLKNNVSEWSVVASEKAEEFTHNSKLRLDIIQLERKLSSLYVKLGLYVFVKTQEKNVLNFVGDIFNSLQIFFFGWNIIGSSQTLLS